jgi:hypothetical protein
MPHSRRGQLAQFPPAGANATQPHTVANVAGAASSTTITALTSWAAVGPLITVIAMHHHAFHIARGPRRPIPKGDLDHLDTQPNSLRAAQPCKPPVNQRRLMLARPGTRGAESLTVEEG